MEEEVEEVKEFLQKVKTEINELKAELEHRLKDNEKIEEFSEKKCRRIVEYILEQIENALLPGMEIHLDGWGTHFYIRKLRNGKIKYGFSTVDEKIIQRRQTLTEQRTVREFGEWGEEKEVILSEKELVEDFIICTIRKDLPWQKIEANELPSWMQ